MNRRWHDALSDSREAPDLVVGVSASVGGLDACREMLAAVPPDSGLAFIVVVNGDPDADGRVADRLQSGNPRLPVIEARGSTPLKRDSVYVISPGGKPTLADGILDFDSPGKEASGNGMVDSLFLSLADEFGDRAAVVLLSGSEADGSEGLRAIRSAGGLCLVQDPATASAPGRSEAVIDAGLADAVLSPEGMPEALTASVGGDARPPRDASPHKSDTVDDDTGAAASPQFERILQVLGDQYRVSFGDYKRGTLERRIRRRMGLKQLSDWGEYAERLAADSEEREALYHDVLIGVTEFFRDPQAWARLAEELRIMLEHHDAPGFRAWVAACGTGEEAYTVAMLLNEIMPSRIRNLQIYATDVNARALAVARRGLYSAESLQVLSDERRERYFTAHEGQYRIKREIRDTVTFAFHNLLADPPFCRMALVTCRNLLIYLTRPTHDSVLKRLHFSLRDGGLLMLGRAERLGGQSRLYDEISKRHSIFRPRRVAGRDHFRFSADAGNRAQPRATGIQILPAIPATVPDVTAGATATRRIEQYVLREHAPAMAVINAESEIQHLYGPVERYLVPPTGESRQDLLAWVRPGFYIRLRSALQQAAEDGEPVETGGKLSRDGLTLRVRACVEPLPESLGADGLLLVTFSELGEAARPEEMTPDSDEPVVRELEQDLLDTRRELQATIEKLETVGEEHRAGHEELLSLNEELQSSNEELEASKEELEALNEELNSVNRELEDKNTELHEVNTDLNSLFLSTGIPTVFLNGDLTIRRFTDAATEVLRLASTDYGRSIEDIKERFTDGHGDTYAKCTQVLDTMVPYTDEVVTDTDRTFLRRIGPYQADGGPVDGLCITFLDITEQKRTTAEMLLAREFAESVIRATRTPLIVLDDALRIVAMNEAFQGKFGIGNEAVGEELLKNCREHWSGIASLEERLEQVVATGEDLDEFEASIGELTILINGTCIDLGREGVRLVLSIEDVTHYRQTEQGLKRKADQQLEQRALELQEDAKRKDRWIALLGHEMRNPFGALGNGITLLKSDSIPADQRAETLRMMDRQMASISAMLDQLLDSGRVIAGKLEIANEPVDLTEVGREAAETIAPLIQQKGHELAIRLPPAGRVRVSGDRLRLMEVLDNLLANAAKFTPPGGDILLEITADDDNARIVVRDNGIGIPEELGDTIFDEFVQAGNKMDNPNQGLGLGLPLVRSLVEAHRGQVQASGNENGVGSSFVVTLPLLSEATSRPSSAKSAGSRADDRTRRILLVDDTRDAAESLATLLENLGHTVKMAGDGPTALRIAPDFEPDVALLDLGMPGMDGYELAGSLRAARPDLVLIAVTGFQKNADALREAGFDYHLLKPVDLQRLRDLLNPKT